MDEQVRVSARLWQIIQIFQFFPAIQLTTKYFLIYHDSFDENNYVKGME